MFILIGLQWGWRCVLDWLQAVEDLSHLQDFLVIAGTQEKREHYAVRCLFLFW